MELYPEPVPLRPFIRMAAIQSRRCTLSLKELQYAEAHDIPWEAYRKDSKEKPAITLDELKKRAATKQ